MVYRKSYSYRRRPPTAYKRKRYTRRRKPGALATKTYVQKQISSNVETKAYYPTLSTTVGNGGLRTPLISLGGVFPTIEGNKITIISITGTIRWGLADASNTCRHTFVLNKKPESYPDFSDVYSDGVVLPYVSPFNYQNRQTYKVMKDQRIDLHNDRPFSNTKIKFIKPITIQLTSTVSWYGKNMPYIFLSSDSLAVTHPSVYITLRVLYRDG